MWTLFWDMHSGGGTKEEPYDKIYIELPEKEAKIYFYNRFGHNPERVTCACCGEDYSINEGETLKQVSGFHRGCRSTETPRDPETGLYQNDHPLACIYLEEGEEVPEGAVVSESGYFRTERYMTLEEYEKQPDVLIVRKELIKPEMCKGEVPEQGYVWKD